jgi:phosphoribosylformylglycinamidine synthase II
VLHAGLVEGIQDLGGAGISCATSELASNGTGGMRVYLDRVPLRDATLTPEEILMSESQERMCAIVPPENAERFLEICRKWDVLATVIGEVTDTGRLVIEWHGEIIVDVPPRTVAHDGPVYERPFHRPSWQDALQADEPTADRLQRPSTAAELRETILRMTAAPNLASKRWVTDQYDRYVLGNTVLAQPEDSGMVRVDEATGRGVAVATDCNGRFAKLDPYAGARLALAEAYRNVSTTGAVPLAVTNCLNFGSPEDPEVMWQFSQAVTGLADGCVELGTPVTGGNVSFYNQTGDVAILPTPVVGVLGVIDDVERRTAMAWSEDGDLIYLLGTTRDEFGGSEWAHEIHGHLGGRPPVLDLKLEQQLSQILVAASRDGLIDGAHDVSDGGVMQTLIEMAIKSGVGARLWVPDDVDPFVFAYAESATRAVVVVARSEEQRFIDMCGARNFPCTRIGVVDSQAANVPALIVDKVWGETLTLSLDELAAKHFGTLPALFGPTVG